MDYSKTVNLPATDFPMKADLPKREPEMLALWEAERVYENALEKRRPQKGKKQFILHDGPPYANGHLHLGHALNKILKDMIVRYKTMTGHYAPYVPGWDCHGLPIELQLMKELKIADKHAVDRATFRAQAKAFAEKFIDIQRAEFKRLGILGDWSRPYLTMDPAYKEVIVAAFQELAAKGYVYRGKKPVYWCATDETALAEAEVEYESDTGPSIYVAFPSAEGNDTFVIWTTTPWTLPANMAIAVHPNEAYARFAAGGKIYIVAEKRVDAFREATGLEGRVQETMPGARLTERTARHPWITDRPVRVLPAAFVAMDTGTGLVHIAPGHGREDFQLGQQFDLPVLSPVNDRGLFTEEAPEWKGEHVFKANAKIIEFLSQRGALLYSGQITHSYPHCWRCHKPVIFRATEQWFLDIDKKAGDQSLRERLQRVIAQDVEWIPAYGQNRIAGMVESRPDWCLSRQRLWGTEIPVPSLESRVLNPESRVPGLESRVLSQHHPASGPGTRDSGPPFPDILDVWFESGVSWAAVLKRRPELSYPADLYLEGSDQHRGWFQTSLIPSVALEGRAPYRKVLTHGFVMDGEGRPMSKSAGNVISPEEVIKQYGADVLRLWVASSDYAGDVRLSPEILKGLTDTYRKVRNTFRYLLGNLAGYDPRRDRIDDEALPDIDRWALHQLQQTLEDVEKAFEHYQFHQGVYRLVQFCGWTLSGFYFDVIKDRLYCDAADSISRRAAQTVLYELADRLLRVWAPVLSFTTDEAWRALKRPEPLQQADFPAAAGLAWKSDALERDWNDVLAVRAKVLLALEKARQAGRIKGGLEAKVSLHAVPAALSKLVQRYASSWPALCLVSQVDVVSAPPAPADWEEGGVAIRVERAAGQKCARCWIYKTDVGSVPKRPDLCARCAGVLDRVPA